ncbi:gas vesicle protein GvpM [Natronorubrum tibetense]|uniref:Gas vesicle protein GvpA n=1 Tax=Natronorubrum tibetense GA33 TaxID=1114856 RepID=L9W8E9_9EURY|nr:gas vesicle protein [Natronorubrum tibetense]ELY45511.1 gas vesicle protein GvpA [Natronorubrum tibetense GA33]
MRPQKNEETLVDVLDVLLRDGAVLRADVVISVAEIPLVGLKLTAALAGMETMNEYGLFEQWDIERRQTAVTRRQHRQAGQREKRTRRLQERERERSREFEGLDEITVGDEQDRD